MDEIVAERKHAAVGAKADLHLVHLAAFLVDRCEVLLPVLGPLHRPPQLHGGEGNQ